MEISQLDFERLLEQVRDLTVRIHRLESLLHVQGPQPAAGPTRTTPVSGLTAAPPPSPQQPSTSVMPAAAYMRNSDLEARIGSHWLNRIGIAAVLIGVSFFLKFAFDSNWIGPAGRIAIGLIAGIAVVLWSERFRTRGYDVFSYSLKAVGIGVLYLSLWASFQVYHLMPSGVVFACMVIVTAATCAMALSQDAEILAAFAITGGFSTPLLLSTGENREIALFCYVGLLDLGILALIALRPWRRLLLPGFAGTLVLYIGWDAEFYSRSQFALTLFFATFFFLIFAVAPRLVLRQERGRAVMPLILALINAVTYFLQGYAMIMEISHVEMAWFSLAMAAVYLALNRLWPQSSDSAAERNLTLMQMALAVGLVTVAIPIRMESHWITIGWFVEAAALLWVGERIKSDLLDVLALSALVLGVARLLFYDNFYTAQLVFNMRVATYGIAIAVLGLVAYSASKRDDEAARNIGSLAMVAVNALALTALSREVADYYAQRVTGVHPLPGVWRAEDWSRARSITIARDFTYSALWMVYGAMLMMVGFWRSSSFVRWQALLLVAATIVKVFIYDTSQLDRVYRILSFVVLGVLLLAISFAYQRDWLKLSKKASSAGASA